MVLPRQAQQRGLKQTRPPNDTTNWTGSNLASDHASPNCDPHHRQGVRKPCDSPRFTNNGDGTVTDNLTTLQWERKTNLDSTFNPGDLHDADNKYAWSTSVAGDADGTLFTTFLDGLNTAGFANQHDWRLPTFAELLNIAMPPFPGCTTGPCIDPVFGPTPPSFPSLYWTSATFITVPFNIWAISFSAADQATPDKTDTEYVRAVRGGAGF